MLKSLQISNYALIEKLNINFESGFSSITGETGAGKSIILGALNLILGHRADTSVLKDIEKKSVVEGTFNIEQYQLKQLFEQHDIDYDDETIFRREILPNGKTRAFINDVPVGLSILKDVSSKLIDIHSQDNTHSLNDKAFQLKVVDAYAENSSEKNAYAASFKELRQLRGELQLLETENAQNSSDLDYYRFQLEQLEQANFQAGEQADLEQERDTMQYAEDIQNAFYSINTAIEQEHGVIDLLNSAQQLAAKAAGHSPALQNLSERLDSIIIELRDIASEAEGFSYGLEYSQDRMDAIIERLSLIYELQQKHRTDSIEGLLSLQSELQSKVAAVDSFDEKIAELKKQIATKEKETLALANALTDSRRKALKPIADFVAGYLKNLGMPNAQLEILCNATEEFTAQGRDEISFIFSANKNAALQEVSKVASGGEKSRLMFTIKLLLAQKEVLPTIIFDEIDTGISGEVARMMGQMMREMGEEMQVLSITHLPQVASCAQQQYKVYKYDETDSTLTQIKRLNKEQREEEIARLLSGDKLSEAALINAKELLSINK